MYKGPSSISLIKLSRTIYVTLHPIFKMFSSAFYIYCEELLSNSDRNKVSSTVSYMGGKQDMHLYFKVNKKRRKCPEFCVGVMLEESVTTRIVWASWKLYNHRRFSTRRENEGTGRSVTRCHAVLSTGFVSDSPWLRGRERPELYEFRESKENLRWLNGLS